MTRTSSSECSGVLKLDRRIAVAPMMDWTDEVRFIRQISSLARLRKLCLFYLSSTHCASSGQAVYAVFAAPGSATRPGRQSPTRIPVGGP
jgi:hypothetical protein